MPRIRSIHPGQWSDEAFVSCSAFARLLALGLRNEADDQGVFEWKPLTIKMRLFPADDVNVPSLLAELETSNQVRKFEADGKVFGAVRNFRRWQRPEKPNAVHPLPSEMREFVGLGAVPPAKTASLSPTDRQPIDDQSPKVVSEEGGRRKEGGDKMEENSSSLGASAARARPPSVDQGEPDAAAAVIAAFDEAVATAFGPHRRRPWPTATDRHVALAWLDAGASPQWIAAFLRERLNRMAADAKPPPKSLSYFRDAVAEALVAAAPPPRREPTRSEIAG